MLGITLIVGLVIGYVIGHTNGRIAQERKHQQRLKNMLDPF